VQQQHGDRVVVHAADTFTNLAEMAALRPPLPETLPSDIAQRVAVFDSLLGRADTEPHQAVEAAWSPLRAIAVELYERRLRPLPFQGFKVVDMVSDLVDQGMVEPRWVDVAYPLYYWTGNQSLETLSANPGIAKTYIALAKSLATALLLAAKDTSSGETG
jgi:hypothetical protein